MRSPRLAALAAAALLALAGCGGDDSGDEQEAAAPTETATATATATPEPVDPELEDTSKKPEVTVPTGDPPVDLQITDIVEGDGAEAEQGDTVSVQYVGVSYSTGEEFDSSWEREPFTFQLGSGSVIPGWEQGVVGMKVGGRRQLVIPPDLAYGEQGQPPIAPNETLVFVVDLLRLR
jgi:peptidylprolyl isomerase